MTNEQPANPALNTFWSLSTDDALKQLSCAERGLSGEEATRRIKQYGPNTFKEASHSSALVLFLSQFKSPITILLIVSAVLSIGLGDTTDALIILAIILISSCLGFWQEKGAANAVTELLKLVQIKCRLVRDGKEAELPVEVAVPGDIVVLTAGDVIPGDSLIIASQELFIDEAAFTGETYPVEKCIGIAPADAPLTKRSNALFMGSHVISGTARALIVRTGKNTEFGKISGRLQLRPPETDFERGIRKFGYLLMEITLVLVLIIFASNVFLHKPVLDSFLFSLALAVGLTPQLLPAIITVNLSTGAREMAKKQVIVKRLSSIENIGSMNILCSDKTGTITEGKVNLKDTLGLGGNHSEKVLLYSWLNATMQKDFKNPIDEAIAASYKGTADGYEFKGEIPYDFIRKRLSVEVRHENTNIIITKGALNNILDICDRAEDEQGVVAPIADRLAAIHALYERLSNDGYRTLGVASKVIDNVDKLTKTDETKMVFLGFITLFDPPKKEVKQTIADMRNLGVSLKIITGDNALVARALAKMVGFEDAVILTGADLRQLSDGALMQKAPLTDIFAEVEPNQKERIINLLKKNGNVVGFMGDGINDAPALHTADVGISVDTAVDVAKEAADIVLLNQNLDVLIQGIISGRKTFANTMKYVFMATSANFGNMFSMAGASLFLSFLPLLPKQILLTNMLTDFPEMTISTDRVDDISISKPHRWDIKFIQRFMIVFGLISSVFDYITFAVLMFFLKADEKVFQAGWFTESVISAALIVLVVRTRLPFFKSLPGKYLSITTAFIVFVVIALPFTPLAGLFGFVRLPASFYGLMLLIVAAYIITAELAKKWFYKMWSN